MVFLHPYPTPPPQLSPFQRPCSVLYLFSLQWAVALFWSPRHGGRHVPWVSILPCLTCQSQEAGSEPDVQSCVEDARSRWRSGPSKAGVETPLYATHQGSLRLVQQPRVKGATFTRASQVQIPARHLLTPWLSRLTVPQFLTCQMGGDNYPCLAVCSREGDHICIMRPSHSKSPGNAVIITSCWLFVTEADSLL